MIKTKKLINSVRNITKQSKERDRYPFTSLEAGMPNAPKSMFITHLVTVTGSTPVMVAGGVMAASSVVELGAALIAASVAGVSAPFVVRKNRRKKYREELASSLNAYLPQVALTEVPSITPLQAKALDEGRSLEIPLSNGSTLAITFGNKFDKAVDAFIDDVLEAPKKAKFAGVVRIIPADNGINEFDDLLQSLSETNPDIATAFTKVSEKPAVTGTPYKVISSITKPSRTTK